MQNHDKWTRRGVVTTIGAAAVCAGLGAADPDDGWTDKPATGVVRVVSIATGDPITNANVKIENFAEEHVGTKRTDASGSIEISGTVDSADEVITVYVSVRGQREKFIIGQDETHGVQELTLSVPPKGGNGGKRKRGKKGL